MENLKLLRNEAELSQETVAEAIGVTLRTYKKWEDGGTPTKANQEKLKNFFENQVKSQKKQHKKKIVIKSAPKNEKKIDSQITKKAKKKIVSSKPEVVPQSIKPKKEKVKEVKLKKEKRKRIKQDKKVIQSPKKYSQRKVNFIVYGSVFLLVALSALSIFSNVARNLRQPKNENAVVKVEEKNGIDNQATVFLNAFIKTYFNQEMDKSNQDNLLPFYGGTLPDMKQSANFKGQTELKQSTLLIVSDNLGRFQVDYKIKGSKEDVWHDETVQFNVPFETKEGKYYVSDLPYMTNAQSLTASKAKQANLNKSTIIYDETWKKKADSFLQAFFKAYTTDDNSLSTISRDVKSVNGYQFKTLDYSYYNQDKDKKQLNAQVQVTFQDKYGNTHSENFTLDLTKKEDIFFVNHLSHGIKSMKEMKKEVSK